MGKNNCKCSNWQRIDLQNIKTTHAAQNQENKQSNQKYAKDKICIETNENENTTIQNLWGSVKAVLREKFIAIWTYLKKQEINQINNLTLNLKQLEKEEMKQPRVSRRKEIVKIGAKNKCKINKRDQSQNKQR